MDNEDKKYPKELYNRGISTSTNPGNVNQLQEYLSKISSGYPGVEIQTFTFSGQKGWANIPRQIFEEIARNAKINNVEVTIHAPENDFQLPATDEKGNIRENNIKQMAYKTSVILESAEIMSKIYGEPIKVNMHAGDLTLTEWDKDFERRLKDELLNNYELRKSFAEKLYRLGYITSEQYNILTSKNINMETLEKNVPSWAFAKQEAAYIHLNGNYEYIGSVMPARYLSGAVERAREPVSAVDEIYKENEKVWMNIFNDIDTNFYRIKKYLLDNYQLITSFGYSTIDQEKIGEFLYNLKRYRSFLERVKEYIDAIEDNINDIADPNLREAAKNKISQYKQRFEENLKKIENYENEISKFAKEVVQNNNSPAYRNYFMNKMFDFVNDINSSVTYTDYLLSQLKNTVFSEFPIPIVKPYQEVAIKTAPEVIAEGIRMLIEREISKNPNGWYKDFDKYLSYINIEESYPGAPATRPDIWKRLLNNIREEVKKVIEKYMERFPDFKNEIEKKYGSVDNFVKERIGATLDVGHIKMFEKYGYNKEDILKWVEEIKPEIKHLHVHETQAGEDTHLALGMGWDDIIASELEKLRDILENKKVTIVHEPGGFYVHQFNKMYGNEYYNLLAGAGPYDIYGNIPTQFNTMLPYGGTQVIPEYIQYTRYSPYSVSIFSQLPIDLGGTSKKQETFSGEKAD
jgi:sugar phosphate isomerase/epimerase/gas vesicle protein